MRARAELNPALGLSITAANFFVDAPSLGSNHDHDNNNNLTLALALSATEN
jgi:hypothetical protein